MEDQDEISDYKKEMRNVVFIICIMEKFCGNTFEIKSNEAIYSSFVN